MSIAPKGQDIRFSEDRIQQGRNFCNKLWNVARFRTMSGAIGDNDSISDILARVKPEQIKDEDNAILVRLKSTIDEVENPISITNLIPFYIPSISSSGTISAIGTLKTLKTE